MRSARSASLSCLAGRSSQCQQARRTSGAHGLQHKRLDDRTGLAVGKIEAVVAVERVGLKDAGVTRQVPLGMLPGSIARGVEQPRRGSRCRRTAGRCRTYTHAGKAGHRPTLGEDGNRRIVAMQPLGSQDMALDQSV